MTPEDVQAIATTTGDMVNSVIPFLEFAFGFFIVLFVIGIITKAGIKAFKRL